MSPTKYPQIFCIDGVDGCGKATVSQMVKERLESQGYRIATISPPFYQTNTGKAIMDYLNNGYGCISDRMVASELYSNDRNMFYRDHFDEIFKSGNYDIVLYDRNWLSNIFYQTTIICQSPEDTARFYQKRQRFTSSCWSNPVVWYFSLPAMHDLLYADYTPMLDEETYKLLGEAKADPNALEPEEQEQLWELYKSERALMVAKMIYMSNQMEIEPWTLPAPLTTILRQSDRTMIAKFNDLIDLIPFTDATGVKTVVLCPCQQKSHVEFIHKNLMQRYAGDVSKLDRNERSDQYLYAVVENVHWIRAHMSNIFTLYRSHFRENCNYAKVSYRYAYEIVHTTTSDAEGKVSQRELEAIANEVYNRMMS